MKHRGRYLFALLGYLIIMTNLSGCVTVPSATNPATSSSINYREAGAVEAQFEPLFQFLAEEKKDFSQVESIATGFEISELKGEEYVTSEEYSLIFRELPTSKVGEYIVSSQGETTIVEAQLNQETATITFPNETETKLHEFVLPIVSKEDLQKHPIVSYMAEHPETELKSISYDVSTELPMLKQIIERYNISTVTGTSSYLSKSGNHDYFILLDVESVDKMYSIALSITLR